MAAESGASPKRATTTLIAGLVGLWPILFALVLWALAQWGAGEGEFSLAPRETMRNVIVLLVALAITLAWNIVVIVGGIRAWRRRVPARGRALAGLIAAAVGALFVSLVLAGGLAIALSLRGRGEHKLSAEEQVKKCRSNQESLAIMLGPEMWGFDHPEAKPEDLKTLDLSPQGDLIEPEDGPAYATDPLLFDCPADDDPPDVDYVVDITPEGEIKIRCIDPDGIKAGHNP
jgi:hypothetical protein